MEKNSKVCRQLHLPVQSGSNRILKQMKRTYSIEWYRECILKLKESMPDLSLSTDIIVGFPGENEQEFQETLDLMEQVVFDSAYTFKYSSAAELLECQQEYIYQKKVFQLLFMKSVQNQAKVGMVIMRDWKIGFLMKVSHRFLAT